MSVWKNKLVELLTKSNYLLKIDVPSTVRTSDLAKADFSSEINDLYIQIGGKADWQTLSLPAIDIWAGDYYLIVDDHLQFNRYRAITLKSSIYQASKILTTETYARYCRQFEVECRKAGLARNLWTNATAEEHFGVAADEGEYEGNGSPAWKLRAFLSYLTDCAAIVSKQNMIRIPIYANLMVGGQLQRLDKMLMVTNDQYARSVQQWLARSIGQPA